MLSQKALTIQNIVHYSEVLNQPRIQLLALDMASGDILCHEKVLLK